MALAVIQSQPTRLRQSPQDIRAVVESLRRRHKAADNARTTELLLELVGEDHALLRVAVRFVVDRIAAQRRPTVRERIARQAAHAAEKVEVKALAAKARQTIMLDTLVTLPSGEQKQLRYATKAELNQAGGLYLKLAERLETPDEMCGERWTEGELKALLQAAV
jgi:hypothetical protein